MLDMVLAGIAAISVAAALWLAKRLRLEAQRRRALKEERDLLQQRFATIVDVDAEAARVRQTIEHERNAFQQERSDFSQLPRLAS